MSPISSLALVTNRSSIASRREKGVSEWLYECSAAGQGPPTTPCKCQAFTVASKRVAERPLSVAVDCSHTEEFQPI
ncbi:hypothetical protein QYF61_025873 [Mycteria americana]|uniref:Uncharacterized protein n=1 Tax=Mycteria americana TaxID=33587 RepID=A0AAN7PX19_MYCAM|nr:hypothetical protein QYF61_025873 [Mycteria americana]